MGCRKTSLRFWLVVPFIVQMAATVGLVGYLSLKTGRESVDDISSQLRQELSNRIQQQLKSYVETPFLLNDMNAIAMAENKLDLTRLEDARPFWQQAQNFSATNLIYCGRQADGAFMGVGQDNSTTHPSLKIQFSNAATNYYFNYAYFNGAGDIVVTDRTLDRQYDPRKRPWYIAAQTKGTATWSDIYLDFDDLVPVITASEPVYDRDGALVGVCATDFLLSVELDSFLSQLSIGKSGETFIIERSGLLVSSSTSDEEKLLTGEGESTERLAATQSQNWLVRETANHLLEEFGNLNQIKSVQQISFEYNGKQLVQVVPFQDDYGLDWLIVVVVPETDFIAPIQSNTYITIWLCLIALGIATQVGVLTARHITKPLLQLNAGARKIADGDWDQSINLTRTDEVGDLARSFNHMVSQLKKTFAEKSELDQALTHKQAQLSQILEALPIGVAMIKRNGDHQNSYLNQAGKQLLNLEGDSTQLIDQLNNYPICQTDSQQSCSLDTMPLLRALQGETVSLDALEIHRSDGQVILLEIRAIPVLDDQGEVVYAISTFQDISQRKQAESSLREQEAQFRRIAESVPGVLYRYVVHTDGRSHFAYISPRCREIFELEPEAILQDEQAFWSLLEDDDIAILQKSFDLGAHTLQPRPIELRLTTPSGQCKYIQVQSCVDRLPNGDVVWDGIVVDFTERKWIAHLLEEYNQSLEREVHDRTLALEQEIAERKQIEIALRESEAQNQAMVAALPDLMFCLDENGTYLGYFRTNYVTDLVSTRDNPVGKTVYEMLPTHVADRHIEYIHKALATGQLQTYEQVIQIDYILQYEEVRVMPTANGQVLFLIRDISDRKQMEVQLQAQQEFLKNIVDVCPYPIFVKDADGRFLLLNQACTLIYGKPIAEMLGKRDADFNTNPDQVEKFIQSNQVVMRTLETQIFPDTAIVDMHGVTHWYQTIIKPLIDTQGQVQGIVGSAVDISDRKYAEAALQQAKESAEAANRAKSSFLAGMSHELRTPLNAILGFAQIMQRDAGINAEQKRNLEIINRSGEHLLGLINSVLDLSKIEAGHLELNENSFDLLNLIQTVDAMLQIRATLKGIQLNVELDPDVPHVIIADPGKLRQILINLIGNAIKFTDVGSVTLRVKRSSSTSLDHKPISHCSLRFEIQDTGVGIAANDIDRIFEAFEQTSSGKKLTEGTGLGLTLSRKFVELMGGSISVSSVLNQGSTFGFDIVVEVGDTLQEQPTQSDRLVIGLSQHRDTYRILAVDDQPENRELLVKLLEPIGFLVKTAANGEEAIALWQDWHPHLILMDIRMPVLNGMEATEHIRLQEQTANHSSHTQIIALSASVFQADRDRALTLGCDGFLKKPFRSNELLDKLAHYLDLHYIYADQDSPEISTQPFNFATAFKTVPPSWVEQLHQVTSTGDDVAIMNLLSQLSNNHSQLTTELSHLAQRFEFDRILSILEGNYNE
ncbi:MAG: PAS domain-containing protein [Oculatellaceae cyanobacterium bins.114]|nr:PAS domain-containing protein [Oculatellaceae cyanobacterium bins.114]